MKERNHNSGKKPHDQTEDASFRSDQKAREEAHHLENDEVTENRALGNITGPEGDNSGENKVATLDD